MIITYQPPCMVMHRAPRLNATPLDPRHYPGAWSSLHVNSLIIKKEKRKKEVLADYSRSPLAPSSSLIF